MSDADDSVEHDEFEFDDADSLDDVFALDDARPTEKAQFFVSNHDDEADDKATSSVADVDNAATAVERAMRGPVMLRRSFSEEPFVDRKLQLEAKLDARPARQQLVEANILVTRTAPRCQAAARRLDFKTKSSELEARLDHRPSVDALVDSNILKPRSVAGAVQAAQQSLKFRRTKIDVDAKLQRRPDVDDLVECNIIKAASASGVAPALVAAQQQLQFQRTVGALDKKFEARTSKQRLVASNILKDDKVAPNLVTASQELKFHRTVDRVNTLVANRPPRDELRDAHILGGDGPLVHSAQHALSRHRIEQLLDDQLAHRTEFHSPPESPHSRTASQTTSSDAE